MARGRVTVIIDATTERLNAALAEAQTKLAAFSSSMMATGAKLRSIGTSMTLGMTVPLVGASVVAVKFAGELEDAQAMSQQVFGNMAKDMDKWAANAAKNFGLSKGEALEWANQIGIRLRSVGGMAADQAARTSKELTQLAGDFASAFGGSVAEAAQAISSGLTGEFEPLKRYGVVINDTALKAKLFQLTGEKVSGTLTAQQKVVATLALLKEQASIVEGDYARNAMGATNAQRTMAAELKNVATQIGTSILPIATKLVLKVGDLARRFSELSPTTQKVIVIIGGLAAAAGPVVFILGALATAIGAILSPAGLVVAAIVGVGAALVAAYQKSEAFRNVVNRLGNAVRDILGRAIEWVRDVGWPALKAVFDAVAPKIMEAAAWIGDKLAPVLEDLGELIGVVAQRVGQGIGLIVEFFKTNSETIMNIVRPVWEAITAVISGSLRSIRGIIQFVTGLISGDWSKAWTGIKNFFGGIWDNISGLLSGALRGIWNALVAAAGFIRDVFVNAWSATVEEFRNAWSRITSWVSSIASSIKNAFTGAGSWLVDAGRKIISGLWDGLKEVWNKVAGWLGGIGGWIKKLKGPIEKDRRLLIGEGSAIMAGLGAGLQAGWADVSRWLGSVSPEIVGTISASATGVPLAPAGPGVAAVAQPIEVHFHGPVAGRDAERWIIDTLARARREGRI